MAERSDYLLDCLSMLAPAGPDGFEGLVRDLLELWTGRGFRLARSGSQFGHDAMGDRDPVAPILLAECKRYGDGTALSRRELSGEVIEAIERFPDLDLWVLAATKELGSNEVDQAGRIARMHAVEFCILDSRDAGCGRLQAFCARHPERVMSFVERQLTDRIDTARLEARLRQIASSADFERIARELDGTLSGTLLGFADAKRRVDEWLTNKVASVKDAQVAFGQDLALLDGARPPAIPRRGIASRLDHWWGRQAADRHFALLGEEGCGKSWATLAWLLDLARSPDGPLIVPVTSKAVPEPEIIDTVAHALHRITRRTLAKEPEWWIRRVAHWWDCLSVLPRPPILLWIDGINELPRFGWRKLLLDADATDNRGRVAILATCRPGYWREHIAEGVDGFETETTEGYDEDELRQATQGRIDLSTVPAGMRDLMRRPRYCGVVLGNYDVMLESGDWTVERLLYEDFRARRRKKASYPLSGAEFDQIVGRLAEEQLRAWRNGMPGKGFTKREIDGFLSDVDDGGSALQEILEGGLLVRDDGGVLRPYRIERNRLVYGLGLVLADEMQSQDGLDVEEIAERVEEWFEPQRDMDIKTAILGAAVFCSLRGDYPAASRQALLRTWVGSRNMPVDQEHALAAYLPECVADVLEVTEHFFTAGKDDHDAKERFGHALAKRRMDERVVAALAVAAHKWTRIVGADSPADLSGGDLGHYALSVTDDWVREDIRPFARKLVWAGPRIPMAEAVVQAAVTATVTRRADTSLIWCLRVTDEELWSVMAPRVEELAAKECLRPTAAMLARSIGTREAMEAAAALGLPMGEGPAPVQAFPPFPSGPMVSFGPALRRIPWSDLAGKEGELPPHVAMALKRMDFRAADYRTDRNRTEESERIEAHFPTLAYLAPKVLADFLRLVVRKLPDRTGKAQDPVLAEAPQMSLVLGPEELAAVRSLQESISNGVAAGNQKARDPEVDAFLTLAMRLPPDEAAAMFALRPEDAIAPPELLPWFSRISETAASEFQARAEVETHPRRLARVLLLASCSPQPATDGLRRVIRSAWLDEAKDLSFAAMRFVSRSEDPLLVAELVDGGRRFDEDDGSVAKRLGAELLVRHGGHRKFSELLHRLSLADAGLASVSRGLIEDEVAELAAALDTAVWKAGGDPATVEPRLAARFPEAVRLVTDDPRMRLHTDDHSVTLLKEILARHPETAMRWASAACADDRRGRTLRRAAGSFFQSLAATLVDVAPASGFALWRRLRADGQTVRHELPEGVEWMACLPFLAPDSPEAEEARTGLLSEAMTDSQLADLALAASAAGRSDWILEQVEAMVRSKPLWRRGKGLCLAALSDFHAEKFGGLVEATEAEGTWLMECMPGLDLYHRRNVWARTHYGRFLAAATDDDAYAAFLLFLRCADRRCRLWMDELDDQARLSPAFDERRALYRHTLENGPIAKAIKSNEEALPDRFLAADAKLTRMAPFGVWQG